MNSSPLVGSALRELRRDVASLRSRVESNVGRIAYYNNLRSVIADIEEMLTSELPDSDRVRKGAFGLFRLVTDSVDLESSEIGKNALEVHARLRHLADLIDTS